jgi:hypothetical protein
MRAWLHERLFGRPKTRDSFRRKRRDIQDPAIPHLLREPLLGQTIRRRGHRGESIAPKKRHGSTPKFDEKAKTLLEEDLEERPFATLRERCVSVEAITGISVSCSTMCRAIARIGTTRKKGDE